MMLNPANSTADRLGLKVDYKGVNGVKQHCFAAGGPLVNHVYATLEEGVARFGARLNTNEKFYTLSAPFKQGYAAETYAPRSGAKGQELIEYGLGYLKRLLEKKAATPAPAPAAAPLVRYPPPAVAKKPVTPVGQTKASEPQNTRLSSTPVPKTQLASKPIVQQLSSKPGPQKGLSSVVAGKLRAAVNK